ncbi:MAG: pilus assembly protein PilP [Proteobacteria bacterium]|nr:pilus assembly protein PilP [Pseudomonadota bacterium]
MVKLVKISIVILVGAGFMFLSGCEQGPAPQEPKSAPVIVSGTILPSSSQRAPKKPTPKSEMMAQTPAHPPLSLPKTGFPAIQTNPAGTVTEEQAKNELRVAVVAVSQNPDVGETAVRYNPAGKIDPFIPLLQDKEISAPVIEEKPKRMLTPLEKIALGQIKLVAVIQMKNRQIAMVEDATGKGYEVKIGTYIGKNSGQVSEIHQSSILVKEFLADYKGKRQVQFQEIKLHKNESGE